VRKPKAVWLGSCDFLGRLLRGLMCQPHPSSLNFFPLSMTKGPHLLSSSSTHAVHSLSPHSCDEARGGGSRRRQPVDTGAPRRRSRRRPARAEDRAAGSPHTLEPAVEELAAAGTRRGRSRQASSSPTRISPRARDGSRPWGRGPWPQRWRLAPAAVLPCAAEACTGISACMWQLRSHARVGGSARPR